MQNVLVSLSYSRVTNLIYFDLNSFSSKGRRMRRRRRRSSRQTALKVSPMSIVARIEKSLVEKSTPTQTWKQFFKEQIDERNEVICFICKYEVDFFYFINHNPIFFFRPPHSIWFSFSLCLSLFLSRSLTFASVCVCARSYLLNSWNSVIAIGAVGYKYFYLLVTVNWRIYYLVICQSIIRFL